NWRSRAGELDIVAREGPVLVVAEVKTRTSVDHGHPAEAVDIAKRRRLHALARAWARQHRVRATRIRVDVIAILAIGGRVFVSHERGVDRSPWPVPTASPWSGSKATSWRSRRTWAAEPKAPSPWWDFPTRHCERPATAPGRP